MPQASWSARAPGQRQGIGEMKGWQIFRHSVQLVLANLDQALRISLVLYIVQSGYVILTFFHPPAMAEAEGGMEYPVMTPETAVLSILVSLLAVVASLWIAVAWHRFVLTSEYPEGWLPRWHGGAILSYLGRSILVAILIVLAVTVAALPVGFLAIAMPGLAGLFSLLLVGLGAYLFFRLGVMLPAAAVGERLQLGDAWDATRGESGTIVVLSAIVVVASVIVQLPSWFNNDPGSVIGLVYSLVVNWFATIIGISVLTTLYGHFIEDRSID